MGKKEFDESIFFKFLSGTATDGEAENLIQYMKEERENRLTYFRQKRIWQESYKKSRETGLIDNSWERLKIRMEESGNEERSAGNSNFRFSWRRLAVAASITILIGTSGYLGYQKYRASQFPAKELQVNAPLGSRSNIVLPDGSIVWLNSGSKLTYNDNFGETGREVSLVGEAFFDIKHLGNTSFIVNTSDLKIRVLGTQFNVKSYPDEQIIETTLVKGKIKVEKYDVEKSTAPIIMTPNQKLIYTKKVGIAELNPVSDKTEPTEEADVEEVKKSNIRIIKKVNPQDDSSWKDGKLIIKHESLGMLVRKLERYYNVNISFEDDSIKQFVFSGTLNEVTIEEVLRALEKTSPIRFNINKGHVILALTNNE